MKVIFYNLNNRKSSIIVNKCWYEQQGHSTIFNCISISICEEMHVVTQVQILDKSFLHFTLC